MPMTNEERVHFYTSLRALTPATCTDEVKNCRCGNTLLRSGFFACDVEGTVLPDNEQPEATAEETFHYWLCLDCGSGLKETIAAVEV